MQADKSLNNSMCDGGICVCVMGVCVCDGGGVRVCTCVQMQVDRQDDEIPKAHCLLSFF